MEAGAQMCARIEKPYSIKVFSTAIAVDVQLLLAPLGVLIHQIQQLSVSLCPDCLQMK